MADKKLHILLVNNYTARGGIPRAVSTLANAMAERGHKITIISQKPVPRLLKPLYDAFVKIRELSLPEGKRAPLPLGTEKLEDMYELRPDITIIPYRFTDKNLKIQKLRKKIKALDPDVCVCMLPDGSHLVWAVTLLGTGIPYIYSEHHCPETIENVFWTRKGRLAAMSGADAIHLLLPSYLESLSPHLQKRAKAIPNVCVLPAAKANPAGIDGQRKVLLWLGRLHESLKQCRVALDAFALLANKFPDWDMHIAGDGQDKALIHSHAQELEKKHGIKGRIKFLGEQKDVWPIFASAQAFCFSSRTEGLPLALLEAQASGLPCVAFSQCQGMEDLVRDGETGLLAPEMTAHCMAEKFEILLADDGLREKLGNNARNGIKMFSDKIVHDAWEDMLASTAAHKGATAMDDFGKEPFASLSRLSSMARREWLCRDFGDYFPGSLEEWVTWNFYKRHIHWFKATILNRTL